MHNKADAIMWAVVVIMIVIAAAAVSLGKTIWSALFG